MRDIERDRVGRPHPSTVTRLSDALRLSPSDHHHLLSLAVDPATDSTLFIGVLGSLVVRRGVEPVDVGPHKVRVLLGLLALQVGQPVPLEVIVDALWPGRPPRTYRNLVHTYVARLRGHVGAGAGGDAIVLTRGGYRLALPHGQLDVTRFEELAAAGRRCYDRGEVDDAVGFFASALGCWRGAVLADLGPHLGRWLAAAALTQRRWATALALGDTAIQTGRYAMAVDPLRELAEADPLHEAVHARLMLALAGSGQQAAALRVFATVCARLAEELGVEPGEQLLSAQLRVLRQDLPAAVATAGQSPAVRAGLPTPDLRRPAPDQLPADTAHFTGRDAELDQLTRIGCGGDRDPSALTIAMVTGPPGVGKTVLAVRWARRAARLHPDGQLYLDLRGYSADPPVQPIDALRQILTAYGVAPERVPVDQDEAAALYRTVMSGRRALVLLDNAASAAQVRPLLPGSPTCLVLVTSRNRLDGLVAAAGAHRLELDGLPADTAVDLLSRIIGRDRVRAEPAAAAALADVCSRLPLALRIAGAHLSTGGTSIAGYVEQVRREGGLARLSLGEDDPAFGVETAFAHSYLALSTSDRRLFRLIGWAPGNDVTAAAAAALAGGAVEDVASALERLARAHLVQPRTADRFRLHDLLRLYAADRCRAEDGDAERDAGLSRLLEWYTDLAAAAGRLLYPQMTRLHTPPTRPAVGSFPDHEAALAWLDGEWANIAAAIRVAAGRAGPIVGHLANALRGYLEHRRLLTDWLVIAEAGRSAFVAAGDRRGEAASVMSIAIARGCLSDLGAARDGFTEALTSARRHGWSDVEAVALNNLGFLYQQIGDMGAATEHFEGALRLYRCVGWEVGQCSCLCSLGSVHHVRGMPVEAEAYLAKAVNLAGRIGAVGLGGQARQILGRVLLTTGQVAPAARYFHEALRRYRRVGNRHGEANALNDLAGAHTGGGDHRRAAQRAEAAYDLAVEIGYGIAQVDALNRLGEACLHSGDSRTSAAWHRQALELAADRQQRYPEVEAMIGLASALAASGDGPPALATARQAVTRARRYGYRGLEARARDLVAAARKPWSGNGAQTSTTGQS